MEEGQSLEEAAGITGNDAEEAGTPAQPESGEEDGPESSDTPEPESALPEELNVPVWTTTGNVNLRGAPNTDSEVLTVLRRNVELVLKYEEDGWGAVRYENSDGYVKLDYDINISNMERAQYATSVGADIAVRIHANGVENSSVSGALVLAPSSANPYISALAPESQRLSKCILDAYCETTGMNNQGVTSSDTMTGINWSTVPVTILEMGYMTNPEDDMNMEDESYQKRMVQGIADGVDDYFGF